MKDGIKVRTLEELRSHFDAEKVLLYYREGKLLSWLSDRHYDEYIAEFKKIRNTDNPLPEICRVLDIKDVDTEYIDVGKIEQKNKKILKVKEYTDRKEVLDNIDLVAVNQKEFEALVKAEEKVIYLCGSQFVCPLSVENVTIEGIDNPKIVINTTEIIDFEKKNVMLRNLIFDVYQASSLFNNWLSDEGKKESQKLYGRLKRELIDVVFDVNTNKIKSEDVKIKKFQILIRDVVVYLGGTYMFLDKIIECFVDRNPQNIWLESLFNNALNFCISFKLLEKCKSEVGLKRREKAIETCDIIEVINIIKICNCGFDEDCNAGSHVMFWLIFIISIDKDNYNNNLNVVSDTAFMLGFDEEKLSDWIIAVKGVLAEKKLSELEYQTEEGKKFFIREIR